MISLILSQSHPQSAAPLCCYNRSFILQATKKQMGVFVNKPWVKSLAWIAAIIIVVLNARLVFGTLVDWIAHAGDAGVIIWCVIVPLIAGLFFIPHLYLVTENMAQERNPPCLQNFEHLEFTSHPFTIHRSCTRFKRKWILKCSHKPRHWLSKMARVLCNAYC